MTAWASRAGGAAKRSFFLLSRAVGQRSTFCLAQWCSLLLVDACLGSSQGCVHTTWRRAAGEETTAQDQALVAANAGRRTTPQVSEHVVYSVGAGCGAQNTQIFSCPRGAHLNAVDRSSTHARKQVGKLRGTRSSSVVRIETAQPSKLDAQGEGRAFQAATQGLGPKLSRLQTWKSKVGIRAVANHWRGPPKDGAGRTRTRDLPGREPAVYRKQSFDGQVET